MSDPLAQLERDLARLADATPLARRTAELVAAEIDARFARGEAPVDSGALRASVRVEARGDGITIESPLPYAERHPEIVPPPADIEACVRRAMAEILEGRRG